MIDSTTAGSATHHKATIVNQCVDIALSERVLVKSHDNGPAILPQIEDNAVLCLLCHEIVLDSHIPIRISLGTYKKQ